MRRVVFLFIILAGITAFAVACSKKDEVPKTETEIYFVDLRMNRLLEYKTEITDADTEHMVQAVFEELVHGRDGDENIRRVIPDKEKLLRVSVRNDVAYVDINSDIKEFMGYGYDTEKLFVYEIVNTLTSVRGVRFVKFTVDGEVHKDFMGFMDMRETYKYCYPE